MTTVPITGFARSLDSKNDFLSEARSLVERLNGRLHGSLRALSARRRDGLAVQCQVLDGTVCMRLAPEE